MLIYDESVTQNRKSKRENKKQKSKPVRCSACRSIRCSQLTVRRSPLPAPSPSQQLWCPDPTAMTPVAAGIRTGRQSGKGDVGGDDVGSGAAPTMAR